MIAKLEGAQINAYQNKDQTQNPPTHTQWEVHKTMNKQQNNHRIIWNGQQRKPPRVGGGGGL